MKSLLLTLALMASFTQGAFAEEKSPFTDVQYDSAPSVTVEYDGETYFLLAVNGVKRADIMDACTQKFADDCQEKFALNFLEVMAAAGQTITDTVDLRLYKFSGHRVVTVEDAAVTAENVDEILFNRELREE